MATYNKFEVFVEDLLDKIHDLFGIGAGTGEDNLDIYLTNATPSASADAVKADLAEIATGNGYAGPQDTQNSGSRSGGTASVIGTDIVITASGGTIGPFRYVVLFNDTPSSPTDPLIAWWDYGSAVTLNDGETFTVDFGATLFTVT